MVFYLFGVAIINVFIIYKIIKNIPHFTNKNFSKSIYFDLLAK